MFAAGPQADNVAVRGLRLIPIEDWTGYNTYTDPQETPPNAWIDSSNVIAMPTGNAMALRSPANFNTALATGNKVLSAVEYTRSAGAVVIFDINATAGTNVATYVTSNGPNTLLRSTQADARWQSLNINNSLYRVNRAEFIQYVTSFAAYAVGIAAPSSAPIVVLTGGGAGALTTGVYVSYAYYNVSTTHIGQASDPSGISGATSAGSNTVNIAVTASTQTGVTKIVVFISEDGGTVRYLLTDSNGDIRLFPNTTGSITVAANSIFQNFNVEETVFNAPPPPGITFIGRWKNRIMGALGRLFCYSGFDQISAGVPQEAWPPLNVITIPSESEVAECGIETTQGWLAFSDQDNYLISGEPTDKVDSGENVLQITEQFDQLGWGLGTRSPLTIVNTPYGPVWLDKNKHLQWWPLQGTPKPIALGVWPDLNDILDTDGARAMAEAVWFGAGGGNGGFYVLTAQTPSYVSDSLARTPSLFLQLNETTGTTAVDISGNGLNGAYQSNPALGVSGPLNGSWSLAVTLNGTTQYVSVPNNALLEGDTFSLDIMVKPAVVPSGTYYTLFDKQRAGGNAYRLAIDPNGLIVLYENVPSPSHGGVICTSTVAVTQGAWNHVVVVKNGATSTTIYLNGADVSGAVTNRTIAASGSALLIGTRSGSSEFFSGSIALAGMYQSALSSTTVAALYADRLLTTEGMVNNRVWIVTMIEKEGQLQIIPAPSSIAAQCIFTASLNGKPRCFIGVTDRLREVFDFETQGAGWSTTDRLFFSAVAGNQGTNFTRFHSLRMAGNNAKDAQVSVSNLDGSESITLYMETEGGDYFGLVDRESTRHKFTVEWPNDDVAKHDIQNMRLAVPNKKRVI